MNEKKLEIERLDVGQNRPYARLIRVGGWVYTAGFSGGKSDGSVPQTFEGQCDVIFEKLKKVLATAGGGVRDVVSVTVYLTDVADRPALDKAFTQMFAQAPPVRTTIVVKSLSIPDKRIEMQFVAYVGEADQ